LNSVRSGKLGFAGQSRVATFWARLDGSAWMDRPGDCATRRGRA